MGFAFYTLIILFITCICGLKSRQDVDFAFDILNKCRYSETSINNELDSNYLEWCNQNEKSVSNKCYWACRAYKSIYCIDLLQDCLDKSIRKECGNKISVTLKVSDYCPSSCGACSVTKYRNRRQFGISTSTVTSTVTVTDTTSIYRIGCLLGGNSSCLNGGYCESPFGNCSCALGYEGIRCSYFSGCLLDDCQNNGTCNFATKECSCPTGFIGAFCQIKTSSLCLNSGTYVQETGICNCQPGWSGSTCANRIDTNDSQVGAIVGLTIGLLVFVIIIGLLIWFFRKKIPAFPKFCPKKKNNSPKDKYSVKTYENSSNTQVQDSNTTSNPNKSVYITPTSNDSVYYKTIKDDTNTSQQQPYLTPAITSDDIHIYNYITNENIN